MLSFWIIFHLLIFVFLALDLGVFNRKAHTISVKEAGITSLIWISLALLFNGGIFYFMGQQKGLEFLTGYLIEYSLSVDNIFVFVLIFSAFAVPSQYQHRVLFWGILTALILRGSLIGLGAVLISEFQWILLIFGAFLVFAGIRMLRNDDEEIDLENNRVLKLIRRFVPLTDKYHGQKFFIKELGKRMATPLFMVLLLVEVTDVMFALDSIPAIFAITQDPFIVYTSNVFAILGLRSLYFLLAGIIGQFVFLRYGLAVVLSFVGLKLLLVEIYHIPTLLSLAVIVLSLSVSILASMIYNRRQKQLEQDPQ
ncbi:MAG: TerC family protein [Trueperaceae bacterium]|nr:TerC family protein [Trueperaceae bacterium]